MSRNVYKESKKVDKSQKFYDDKIKENKRLFTEEEPEIQSPENNNEIIGENNPLSSIQADYEAAGAGLEQSAPAALQNSNIAGAGAKGVTNQKQMLEDGKQKIASAKQKMNSAKNFVKDPNAAVKGYATTQKNALQSNIMNRLNKLNPKKAAEKIKAKIKKIKLAIKLSGFALSAVSTLMMIFLPVIIIVLLYEGLFNLTGKGDPSVFPPKTEEVEPGNPGSGGGGSGGGGGGGNAPVQITIEGCSSDGYSLDAPSGKTGYSDEMTCLDVYSSCFKANDGKYYDKNARKKCLSNPTPGAPVTSEFGPRNSPCSGCSSYHNGIDLGVGIGTPVYSAATGTVTRINWNTQFNGNCVEVSHGNGVVTLYLHLKQAAVSVGSQVNAGQLIAYSGNTGVGTGPHLHFQINVNGTPTNPRNYINF